MMPADNDAASDPLQAPIQWIRGIGPRRSALLERLAIRKLGDLLHHFPIRHVDLRLHGPIDGLKDGQPKTIWGRVRTLEHRQGGKSRWIARLEAARGGDVTLIWFQSRWRPPPLREKWQGFATGEVRRFGGPQIAHPLLHECASPEESTLDHNRLAPIYSSVEGIRQGMLRRWIDAALRDPALALEESDLPPWLGGRGQLSVADCYRRIHFPRSDGELLAASRALGSLELFLLAAGQREIQLRRRRLAAPPIPVPAEVDRRIRRRFPFPFTAAQERAIAEITADLARGSPMARLLEGEVGCGKTAVAIYGLLAAVAAGLQGALLVPTAPLAHQHLRVLARLLEGSRVRTALLVGGLAAADGERIRSGLAGGDVDLVVGTHALIEERVSFRRLGLVVIDEEQRFGVRARSRLVAKGGVPHCLKMTATPIPRSLALVHYGEWDRSIIDELPPGRRPVETRWVPEERREDAWGFLQGEIEKGHRILFVLPRIEEGEEGTASVQEAKTRLERSPLGRFPLAVAHGRLPAAEQLAALEGFRSGEAPVLVATTLIEVGLDVPELTVLWIESAERFGLAQLHQLRGRVGRSGRDSWCFVSGNPSGDLARRRFEVFVRVSDGFRLAEEDLVLRGAGEELGTRQSGRSFFRIEHPLEDLRGFHRMRRRAAAILEGDPGILERPPLSRLRPFFIEPREGPSGGAPREPLPDPQRSI